MDAVAGDLVAGDRFLALLRPFVYRRYLDFGALDGLRSMKAMIAAEVERKELADDIKRGPGGIREVEFLAQAVESSTMSPGSAAAQAVSTISPIELPPAVKFKNPTFSKAACRRAACSPISKTVRTLLSSTVCAS